MYDHELEEEELQVFFDKLALAWTDVLDQPNESLGFGLTQSSSHARSLTMANIGNTKPLAALAEQTPVQSREGLMAMLRFYERHFESEMDQRGLESRVSFTRGSNDEDDSESSMS